MDRDFLTPRGFSLIDLLIVIMILGILGTILQPQFSSMISETKLNGAAGEVVSALQYARSLAVLYERVFSVRVKPNDNSISVIDYRYKDDTESHLDTDPPVQENGILFNPFDKAKFARDFDELGEYEGVRITSPPGDYHICFYPDGHSSDADSTIPISLGDEQRTIKVDGITGRIDVN